MSDPTRDTAAGRPHTAFDPPVVAQLNAALTGRYEIEREIGRGGMAAVYLARDLKHDRRVAVKVLDPELGAVLGAERFLSEIRVTANLQHPNLLPLFDSGSTRGHHGGDEGSAVLYYVMPFVEGETLRHRMEREKQLPVDEAVRIGVAIAGALDYAHRHGVIHRDLKPANILLHDGQPLLADFGIALAVSNAGGSRITQTGLSLGTPAYMSPEQATGDRVIDARTDIYSMGAVVYEMLAGEPPHIGNTAQAIIARVLTEPARSLRVARPNVPEIVDDAVVRALEKLPADRFQTARQFADALAGMPIDARDVRSRTTRSKSNPRARPSVRTRGLFALAAVALAAAAAGVGWWSGRRGTAPAMPVHMTVALPPSVTIEDPAGNSVGISPDGRSIVFLGGAAGTARGIYVRRLDQWAARLVHAGDGAAEPRFSPNGQSIAFIAGFGAAHRIDLGGGTPRAFPAVAAYTGMVWPKPDTLIIAGGQRLWLAAANASEARVIAVIDSTVGTGIQDPFLLPDGEHVAVRVSVPGVGQRLGIALVDSGSVAMTNLAIANVIGQVDGWLIFGRNDGTIAAAELDARSATVGERVVQLLDGVNYKSAGGVSAAMSPNGTLAYLSGDGGSVLAQFDPAGRIVVQATEKRRYMFPALSPDGRRLAVGITTDQTPDVWVMNLSSKTMSRLTTNGGSRPEWSPDGKHIYFLREGRNAGISVIPADASAPERNVFDGAAREIEALPDGSGLMIRVANDILRLSFAAGARPTPIVATAAFEFQPRVSNDGKWLAYVSTETGASEVYVRPVAGGGGMQISPGGGTQPIWSKDGRRLFYISRSGTLYAARLQPSFNGLAIIGRDSLFRTRFVGGVSGRHNYDIGADETQIVGPVTDGASLELRVIVNWLASVREKLR